RQPRVVHRPGRRRARPVRDGAVFGRSLRRRTGRPTPAPRGRSGDVTPTVQDEARVDLDQGLLRSTAAITAGNVASRVTGFVRVLAVAAALGTTFLGNTYQTSNLVSNILFELLAAGILSSVLVPTFVGIIDRGDRREAERVA